MSYITPENVLKNSFELKDMGNIVGALEEMRGILHNKKFRGNNIVLERVMLEMIDLCADNLTTQYLKEEIGYFRNICQYTNMDLLKSVLKRLKDRTEEIIKSAEEEPEGESRLKDLLNGVETDQASQTVSAFLSGDMNELNPDDLMILAHCHYDVIEAKQPLMSKVSFFIDVCKIILDTLRQNSKMLDFYNQTAQRIFDFCNKYNYRFEYNRVSETLNSHFNQILKFQKHPELQVQSKIPFPVRLDEEDALQKLLELRYHQLKIALNMKIWSDAFRTTENIYQLINRQKHHASRMKQILADFFTNLSQIFWQSEFYLFHAYAIMNLQQIIKFNKTLSDHAKAQLTAQFVLAVLSVPLNNRLSNFERLSVQYIPSGMEQLQDQNSSARHELFSIASMLQVKGVPSRASLINYVKIKNIHLQAEFPEVQELFRLIEEEESPFTISKKGKAIIDKLVCKDSSWAQYREFLVKTLSVRILQKCRNYFKNLKMSTLKNLLQFYDKFESIEFLLYECNREGLVQTILNHQTQSITFDQEIEVSNNLIRFGLKLREAFQRVQEATSEGKERERIFMKVKEKMEQEMAEVLRRKEDMEKMKEKIARTQAEETRSLQEILQQQQQERERHFAEQQVKEEKERQKNKLLEELELMRRIRAQEVLQELTRRGIKKIGAVKISDMERKGEYDYDEVMSYYQNLLKKEKEAFEGEKQRKLKDIEYWARAVREEEKAAIEKYAKEHGEEEMKQIQRAVRERHEKELKMKQSLEKAEGALSKFKAMIMGQRLEVHETKMQAFVNKTGQDIQNKIIEEAKADLKRVENIRKVKEADERRKKATEEKEKLQKAQGKFEAPGEEGGEGGWSRGTVKQPELAPKRSAPSGQEETPAMTRSGFGVGKTASAPAEEKKDDGPKRPTFNKQIRKDKDEGDTGMLTRSAMTTKKAEEDKKPEGLKPANSDSSAGGWRAGGAPAKPAPTNSAGGFQRGGPAKPDDKKNEKGDDSWSTSGGFRRGPPGAGAAKK